MSKHKSFLFIPDNAYWGGSELLWSESAVYLAQLGHKVVVLHRSTLNIPIQTFEDFKNVGIQCIYRPVIGSTGILGSFKNKFFNSSSFVKKLRSIVKSINPNLIVFNQGYNFNCYDTWDILSDLNFPFVTLSHALNEHFWPSATMADNLNNYFNSAIHNYFVSKANVLITINQLSAQPGSWSVVRNPVYNGCLKTPILFPDSEKNYNLAFVGRFDFKSKGQDLILEVLSDDKWKNRPIHVNFYGSGSDEVALRKLIIYKGIVNATIHGYTQPEAIWASNHALVLTSRYEGLPIVIPEAMMSGRIPIVTDVSGNPEIIVDNVTGYISKGTSPSSIDEALERAWANRFNWKEMGLMARDSIVANYNPTPAHVFANKLLVHLQ